MMVNGGKRIVPTLIDRVQDRHGRTIYRHDLRACEVCQVEAWQNQPPPELPDEREQAVDPATAFQMVGMLQGVVQRGTGRRIAELGLPLAGKTRSEEHTSELQSLMRISYAVFCLKKKNCPTTTPPTHMPRNL